MLVEAKRAGLVGYVDTQADAALITLPKAHQRVGQKARQASAVPMLTFAELGLRIVGVGPVKP